MPGASNPWLSDMPPGVLLSTVPQHVTFPMFQDSGQGPCVVWWGLWLETATPGGTGELEASSKASGQGRKWLVVDRNCESGSP